MKKYLIKLKSSFALLQLTTLPLFIFLSTLSLHAQEIKQKPVDKLLPSLALQLRTSKPTGIGLYTVSVTDLQQIKTTVASNKSIRIVSIYEPAKIIVLETNWTEIEKLLQLPFIRSVDTKKKPTEELLFGFVDYAANRISTIQHYYKQYNAANVNVSIKEQKFDTNDIDQLHLPQIMQVLWQPCLQAAVIPGTIQKEQHGVRNSAQPTSLICCPNQTVITATVQFSYKIIHTALL
jgi:hypothetical protein